MNHPAAPPNTASAMALQPPDCTYQLLISVESALRTEVGKLGRCVFPAGRYVYTGSARRNLAARVARHLSKHQRLRWHVDYLLTAPGVKVDGTRTFRAPECVVNHRTPGRILIPRFGASDCRAGCGSHLKYLGPAPWVTSASAPAGDFLPMGTGLTVNAQTPARP